MKHYSDIDKEVAKSTGDHPNTVLEKNPLRMPFEK